MTEFGTMSMIVSGVFATAIPLMWLVIACGMPVNMGDQERPRRPMQIVVSIVLAITGWLWGPWAGFIIWWISCQSTNAIDYLQRPPQVIPAERQIIHANSRVEK